MSLVNVDLLAESVDPETKHTSSPRTLVRVLRFSGFARGDPNEMKKNILTTESQLHAISEMGIQSLLDSH